MRRKKNSIAIWYPWLVAVGILLLLLLQVGFVYGTVDQVKLTVNKAERVTTGSGDTLSSTYLIYTNSETFQNSDSIWHWKWNSSDIHGQLKEGDVLTAKVYGWRIPFLSAYRNVVEVELQ